MATIHIIDHVNARLSPESVTISGSVEDSGGYPLKRLVHVYNENDLTRALKTATSLADGTFSVVGIPGFSTSKFAVVVQGENGENCAVHSHKAGTV